MSRMGYGNAAPLVAMAVLALGCSDKNLGNDVGSDARLGNTGGSTATGVETGGTSAADAGSLNAYVLDPTLPIDPACTCETSDKICNAARKCVPRCNYAGHCARWLATQAVVDMLVDGNALFYAAAAETDPLGNPRRNGALFRVDTSQGSPVLVATALGNPYKIIGRRNGTTYVLTRDTSEGSLLAVADDGTSAVIADVGIGQWRDPSMSGHWIAYTTPDESALMGIDLWGDGKPVVLVQPSPGSIGHSSAPWFITLDSAVVYTLKDSANQYQTCSLQLANLAAAPDCDSGPQLYMANSITASASEYYVSYYAVASYAAPATALLTLYNPDADGYASLGKLKYANGWLYMRLSIMTEGIPRFVRVPTNVGRHPQRVLPDEIVKRHAFDTFAVSANELFWVQRFEPLQAQAQYIFSAPLRPQPCDAELPCADTSLVCTDGFCSPA